MKQQIISVLAASLFLAGSMATSSAQAFGSGCEKLYDKDMKSCASSTMKASGQAKDRVEKLAAQKVENYKDQVTAIYALVEEQATKCENRAMRDLFDCKIDKGETKDQKQAEQMKEKVNRIRLHTDLCSDACRKSAEILGELKDPEIGDGKKVDEIWQQCQDKCNKGEAKIVEIIKEYISTQK